jgi:hypothetical protein
MKILEQEFDSRGFHFKQVMREGMYAVFEKTNTNGYKGYESVRLKSHNGYEIAGVFIPPAESMPSAETWGADGFSFLHTQKDKALEKLQWMKTKQFNSLPQQIDSQGVPVKRGRGRPRKYPLT